MLSYLIALYQLSSVVALTHTYLFLAMIASRHGTGAIRTLVFFWLWFIKVALLVGAKRLTNDVSDYNDRRTRRGVT